MFKTLTKPLLVLSLVFASVVFAQEKVIIDTDLRLPPQDDSFAVLLALNSPELEVLGLTLVFGNTYLSQETADALKWLEVSGHEDVPLYLGFARPLFHHMVYEEMEQADSYERPVINTTGAYQSYEAKAPLGAFAELQPQEEGAVEFIVRTIMENPDEVTLIPIGPLTNIAAAIRLEPRIVDNVKQVVIMGGSIGSLPTPGYSEEGGNVPEFNFRLDAEAAKIVMTSGMPIVLSPLNVSRKTALQAKHYEEMIAMGGPVADVIEQRVDFRENTSNLMFDQVAVGYVIDPTLITGMEEMYIDVETTPGPDYGLSFARMSPWAGAPEARPVQVQYDLDWPRFIDLFMERMKQSGTAQ